ncbi:MAG: PAS domain S-box protein [Hadesarchaea archaeon]|nr:PAS domain S-box protein [Hadesarchaea archaeon]
MGSRSSRGKDAGDQSELQRLLDLKNSSQPIVIHDRRGRIMVWSQGAERLLGHAPEEMVGKNFSKVLAEDIRLEDKAIFGQALSGEPGSYGSRLMTKDGRTIVADILALPWKDASGKVVAIVRFIGGPTERRKLEGKVGISEEEQRLILDGIQELIAYQDLENRVLWANLAAGRAVGQTPDELVGRFCYEIWHQRESPCEGCPVVKARETGRPQESEIASADGRFWHIRGYPLVNKMGKVFGVIEITSEITERKLMERQTRLAREMAEGIVETVREPLLVLDADLRVVSANRAFYHTFSTTPGETEGRLVFELGNQQWDITQLRELLEKILPQNTSFQDFEVDHEFPKIGRKIMLLNARRIYTRGNKTQFILLAFEDITERRQAEKALRESEEKYRGIVNGTSDVVLQIDLEGNFLYMNKSFEKETGYSFEEIKGRNIRDFLTPESYQKAMERLAKWKQGVKSLPPYEVQVEAKGGRKVSFEVSTNPVLKEGKLVAINILARNVTERKLVEEKLRASEEKYHSLVESSDDSIYLLDRDLRFLFANRAALFRLGLPLDEVVGRSFAEIYSAEAAKRLGEAVKKVLETGGAVQQEHWSERLQGAFLRTISPVRDPTTGEITTFTVVSKEITSLKMMEASLREYGERLRAIIDFSPDAIIITDLENKIIDCNRAAMKMLEVSGKEELVGKDILEIVSPRTKKLLVKEIVEARKQGVKKDLRHDLVNGFRIPTEISISSIPDSTGKPQSLLFLIKDITERERAEERMREFIYKVNNISLGDCCIHSSHKAAYTIFTQLTLHGVPGICFTRKKPEELASYGIPRERMVLVSATPVPGYENVDGLQQVSLRIAEFLKENRRSVVLLDGLEYLVSRSGFDAVYQFLQEKRFSFHGNEAVLLIPVNLSIFTERERALIATEVNIIG